MPTWTDELKWHTQISAPDLTSQFIEKVKPRSVFLYDFFQLLTYVHQHPEGKVAEACDHRVGRLSISQLLHIFLSLIYFIRILFLKVLRPVAEFSRHGLTRFYPCTLQISSTDLSSSIGL